MAAKSIIEVDVRDEAFQKFNALFNKYQAQLKQQPTEWRKASTAQQAMLKGTLGISDAQATLIGQQKTLGDIHKRALMYLRQEESSWQRIRRETTGVAGNIKDMTGQLLKWSSLTGIIGGLVGSGGLFGISRMASGVASGRQSAMGLGTTYGGQKAFGTAFDRYGNTGSFLSSIADAKGDLTKGAAAFGSLGLSDYASMDTATLGAKVLAAVREKSKGWSDPMLSQYISASQLGNLGITPEMVRTLKSTQNGEFAKSLGMFGRLNGQYALGGGTQRSYQDFETALEEAGNKIELVFVKGLAPLIPGMEHLSGSVVKSIETLSGAIPKDAVERIGKGIETFSQYLGSADFQRDVKGVAGAFGWLAGKVRDFGLSATSDPGAKGIHDRVNWAKKHRDGLKTKGELRKEMAEGGVFAPMRRLLFGSTGLPVKPGAGTVNPALANLVGKVPGFDRITAGNDDYHKGFRSAHNQDRAVDFTIKNPADAAMVAQLVRDEMAKKGIKGTVLDEYNHPSSRATAGHIHVQTDVRISNSTGSNINVSTQQAAVPGF